MLKFQIKLKIQNEKLNPLPDPFALDWDNLSETEMKRLVGQLEKTKADLLVSLVTLLYWKEFIFIKPLERVCIKKYIFSFFVIV